MIEVTNKLTRRTINQQYFDDAGLMFSFEKSLLYQHQPLPQSRYLCIQLHVGYICSTVAHEKRVGIYWMCELLKINSVIGRQKKERFYKLHTGTKFRVTFSDLFQI